MNPNQLQELCEAIAIKAMEGDVLAGLIFRHDDTKAKGIPEGVIVSAGQPVPNLEGFRGFRVAVRIEVRSNKPARNAAIYGELMRRILNPSRLFRAAVAAGLTAEDDFVVLDEEISGDRSETKLLRKRSFEIPFLIRVK